MPRPLHLKTATTIYLVRHNKCVLSHTPYLYRDPVPLSKFPYPTKRGGAALHSTLALFSYPIHFFHPIFLYPSRNSDTGSHSRLLSPFPTTVCAFHFCRQYISAISSLIDLLYVKLCLAILYGNYFSNWSRRRTFIYVKPCYLPFKSLMTYTCGTVGMYSSLPARTAKHIATNTKQLATDTRGRYATFVFWRHY